MEYMNRLNKKYKVGMLETFNIQVTEVVGLLM